MFTQPSVIESESVDVCGMSSTKAALRQAKAAIDEHRYEDAAAQAEKVLVAEPQNYHAWVCSRLVTLQHRATNRSKAI